MQREDNTSEPAAGGNDGDDAELAQVMESYLADVEEGRTPAVEELLAAHPRIAERLRDCLLTLQFVEGAANPIADLPRDDSPEGPGPLLGDFRIIRELGRGGMGVVYEAEQVSLRRRVALKVLPFAAVLDEKQVQRFKNEAHAAALLHHTNIVPVFAVGCERGVHYYAMQYIDGRTLAEAIAELREEARRLTAGPLSNPGEAVRAASPSTHRTREQFRSVARLGVQAAEALSHAHQLGVIHRDIKPSNLLLDSRGTLWVADFGLARIQADTGLTLSGDVLGTLVYMSPEQALAKPALVDHRADIYSLGATFYELLTLEPAFRGADRREILRKIAFEEPRAPRRIEKAVPADLETIVMKAMAKAPEERYATAQELADDLRRFLEDKPIAARRPALAKRAAKWSRRHKPLVAAAGAILVSLLAVAALVDKHIGEERARRTALYEGSLQRAVVKIELERPDAGIAESGIRGLEEGSWFDAIHEAAAAARRCAALFPYRPDAHYHLARGLLLLRQEDEAAAELERALACDAGFFPARILLAEMQGKGAPAARAPAPAWVEPWLEARRARRELRWVDAVAAYGRLLDAIAGIPEPYLGMALESRLARGRLCLELKDFGAAFEDFAGAHALWPELIEPVLLLGMTHCAMGNLEEAEARLASLHRSPPRPKEAGIPAVSREEIALAIASTYHDSGEHLRSLAWAERSIESGARETRRADLLLHLGRLEEALAAGRRAVELNPNAFEARIQLGFALGNGGQAGAAAQEMRRAIDLAPQMAWPHAALARILQMQGDHEGAVRSLGRALSLAPRNPLLLIELGNEFDAQGKLDEAGRVYRDAIEVHPRLARAHHNLARVLLHQKRAAEGLAEIRRALELDPQSVAYRSLLGCALDDNGRLEEGLVELRRAVELDPKQASPHQALGWGFLRRGLHTEAFREYTQALALDPKMDPACVNLRILLEGAAHLLSPDDIARLAGAVERAIQEGAGSEAFWALAEALSRKLPAGAGESAARAARLSEALLKKRGRGDPALLRLHATALFRAGRKLEAIAALEEALRHPEADRALLAEVADFRRAVLPNATSFTSIDAALESSEVLVPEGAAWRYFPGRAEPSPGLEWTREEFDDSSWREGASGLGYGDDLAATVLADMRGSYTTVYARRAFDAADPASCKRFLLSVRADDGFVAYLNGVEAGRSRAGRAGERLPFDNLADSFAEEPPAAIELSLEARLVRPGRNVLALQGLNQSPASSDFLLAPVLLAEPASGINRERARELSGALKGEAALGLLAYLEGRVLQSNGDYRPAVEKLEEAARREPSTAEPILRIAECWKAAGEPARAEARVREALEAGAHESWAQQGGELWDSWFVLAVVDLGRAPKEVLASWPRAARGDTKHEGASHGEDLRWALGEIERDGRIRIDCGAAEGYTSPSGAVWSPDRLAIAGRRAQLEAGAVADTADKALFRTELRFKSGTIRQPGYRVPVPPGRYRVTLYFAELELPEPGKRRFDVLLEGEEALNGYEPPRLRAEAKAFATRVLDGFLDIIFVPRADSPAISAVEIERMPD